MISAEVASMESGPVPVDRLVAPSAGRPRLQRFGRYYLLERIGKGGMAEVFRAVTQGVEGFRRMFVVKRILAEKSSSPEFIRMFGDEARISALLHHPNIVQVYDFGQVEGSHFLAMEYLYGKDLASVMRVLRASNLAMPHAVAAFIAREVAIGLAYAHTLRAANGKPLGIVHRDVTPSNIMLLHTGGVKILDFGIAKATAAAATVHSSGRVKGKFGYLSPEQARTDDVDARSDIFSLGVTLWEMLVGKRLFGGANELETLRNVLQRPVPAPSTIRPGVPVELDRVVARALERDRDRRYQSAEELADDLEQILRESRYDSQSMRRLLHELFGEESSSLSSDVPELPEELEAGAEAAPPGTPPAPRVDVPSVEIVVVESSRPVKRTRSIAPPFGVATASSFSLAQVGPILRSRRWRAAMAALALVACALAYASLRHPARPAPPLPPLSTTAVAPPAAAPAPAAPAPPAIVTVELDSSPRGADVLGPAGEHLGVTPIALPVPRSTERRAFTIAKDGYHSASYEVTPERDSSAFIELPHLHPVPPHATVKHRRGARTRDLGDGMTLDPF
jgi:serine/threonine-protein kinase